MEPFSFLVAGYVLIFIPSNLIGSSTATITIVSRSAESFLKA